MKKFSLPWLSSKHLKDLHLPNLMKDDKGNWVQNHDFCLCGKYITPQKLIKKYLSEKQQCPNCLRIINCKKTREWIEQTHNIEIEEEHLA